MSRACLCRLNLTHARHTARTIREHTRMHYVVQRATPRSAENKVVEPAKASPCRLINACDPCTRTNVGPSLCHDPDHASSSYSSHPAPDSQALPRYLNVRLVEANGKRHPPLSSRSSSHSWNISTRNPTKCTVLDHRPSNSTCGGPHNALGPQIKPLHGRVVWVVGAFTS